LKKQPIPETLDPLLKLIHNQCKNKDLTPNPYTMSLLRLIYPLCSKGDARLIYSISIHASYYCCGLRKQPIPETLERLLKLLKLINNQCKNKASPLPQKGL